MLNAIITKIGIVGTTTMTKKQKNEDKQKKQAFFEKD